MDKKTTGRTLLHELFVRDHVGYYKGLNPANVNYPNCIDILCREKYFSIPKEQNTPEQNYLQQNDGPGQGTQSEAEKVDSQQKGNEGREAIEMDELSVQQRASIVQHQVEVHDSGALVLQLGLAVIHTLQHNHINNYTSD